MGAVDVIEWAYYCVAITFKMTEWTEQWICIKFCVKFKHFSTETIQMIQKAAAMGNQWLETSPQQCACSSITSHAEFFGETSNHPDDSAPPQPRFGALWLLGFPKSKITYERKEISIVKRFRNIQWNKWWWLGELCEVPRCLLWRRLRYHWSMYNGSCIMYLLQ